MGILISNDTVKQLFHIAQSVARENYNEKFGAPHILRALVHKDIDLVDFLRSIGKDPGYIYEWAEVRIEEYPTTTQLPSEVKEDEVVSRVLEEAEDVRLRLGLDEITPLCILAAIVKPNLAFSAEQLKSLTLKETEIYNLYSNQKDVFVAPELKNILNGNGSAAPASFTAIQNYCIDKTAQARKGSLDNIDRKSVV